MNKKIIAIVISIVLVIVLAGCNESSRVSYNLSIQADNFNVRQLTVINCIQGDVLFQMTGKMLVKTDITYSQLEVVIEENGEYKKHFVGLSDNITYIIEDVTSCDVDKKENTNNES